MHEIGHIWGLMHSSVSGSLMTGSGTGNYTSLKKPQTDDINGVRNIYEEYNKEKYL